MFAMINWKRMLAELGLAMAMVDPNCYSYYLASRMDSTSEDRAHDVDEPGAVFRRLSYDNRVRLSVPSQE